MKITVCVIFGGKSPEHDVSVITGIQAIKQIDSSKYQVVPVLISREGAWYSGSELLNLDAYKNMRALIHQVDKVYFKPISGDHNLYFEKKSLLGNRRQVPIDVVIPAIHGANGEDGRLQGLLELMGIPYTGCNTLSSAVCMDKISMKDILKANGLPIVPYFYFNNKEWFKNQQEILHKANDLVYPLVVKPSNLGSSIGVVKASNKEELVEAVDAAFKFAEKVIIEKMVTNIQEINCAVLGDENECITSFCEEPHGTDELLSYEDKYVSKGEQSEGMASTKRTIPAEISAELTNTIQEMAVKVFKCLFAEGVSRIDFMIDKNDGKLYVIEINTLPGSFSFYLFEPAGKPFSELLDELIQLALKRNKNQASIRTDISVNILAHGASGSKLGKA